MAETVKVKITSTDANQIVNGTVWDDRIKGGGGDDSLSGYAGSDYLKGGKGNDFLYGYDGSDKLDGGAGNDVLYGYYLSYYSSADSDMALAISDSSGSRARS